MEVKHFVLDDTPSCRRKAIVHFNFYEQSAPRIKSAPWCLKASKN